MADSKHWDDEKDLRQKIREMIRLERAKPEMTVLIGGAEREEVSWDELEDDLSLALSRWIALDILPQKLEIAEKLGYNDALGQVALHRDALFGGPAIPHYEIRHAEVKDVIKILEERYKSKYETGSGDELLGQ